MAKSVLEAVTGSPYPAHPSSALEVKAAGKVLAFRPPRGSVLEVINRKPQESQAELRERLRDQNWPAW